MLSFPPIPSPRARVNSGAKGAGGGTRGEERCAGQCPGAASARLWALLPPAASLVSV